MTPASQLFLRRPQNIYKISIPPKRFVLLKTSKTIEIQILNYQIGNATLRVHDVYGNFREARPFGLLNPFT